MAGPPYLTDDPLPTDTGPWEIYRFTAGEAHKPVLDGGAGLDLNYGPVKGVQLTATLPLSYSHGPGEGWRVGTGDVEPGIKYRFFNDEKNDLSAAIFPRVILPTASDSPGEKTRVLLPLWLGKDFAEGTSIFGGGGYTINPGAGNRGFWQAAIAVTDALREKVSVGTEPTRQVPTPLGLPPDPGQASIRSSSSPASIRCSCPAARPGPITAQAITSMPRSASTSEP